MLQKFSLILLCGLVITPTQAVHADATCRRLFDIEAEVSNPPAVQRAGLIDYKIENEAGTLVIHRTQSEFAVLFRQGYEISRSLTSKKQLFARFPAIEILLNKFSPFLPYQRIAETISELQMSLIEARNQSELTLAKERTDLLKEEMNTEIKQLEQKIVETENLAYKLEIITGEVSKSQIAMGLQKSLLIETLNQNSQLKENLKIIKALKNDLILVVTTKILRPTSISREFYDLTPAQVARPAAQAQTAESGRLARRPHVYIYDAREKPTVNEAPDYRTLIGSSTGQGTVRPTATTGPVYSKTTTGQGTSRTIEVPKQMLGIVSGQGTTRSTATPGFANPGRGRVITLGIQSGVTAKVVLNPSSRNMILNLEPATKNQTVLEMISELRSWAQRRNLNNNMSFTRGTDNSIFVTLKFEDKEFQKESLERFERDFGARRPILRETTVSRVELNPGSRKVSLLLKYDTYSSEFPARRVLQELEAWARRSGLQNQIAFEHSNNKRDPIIVSLSLKDKSKEEETLNNLREHFRNYSAELR